MKLNQSRSRAIKISRSQESTGETAGLPTIKNRENGRALPAKIKMKQRRVSPRWVDKID